MELLLIVCAVFLYLIWSGVSAVVALLKGIESAINQNRFDNQNQLKILEGELVAAAADIDNIRKCVYSIAKIYYPISAEIDEFEANLIIKK